MNKSTNSSKNNLQWNKVVGLGGGGWFGVCGVVGFQFQYQFQFQC